MLICQFQFLLDSILVIYISLQKVGSHFYHRKILGELIFVFDMECWLHLDFKTHEFKSGDLDDMIELLSTEAMLEFCEEVFAA